MWSTKTEATSEKPYKIVYGILRTKKLNSWGCHKGSVKFKKFIMDKTVIHSSENEIRYVKFQQIDGIVNIVWQEKVQATSEAESQWLLKKMDMDIKTIYWGESKGPKKEKSVSKKPVNEDDIFEDSIEVGFQGGQGTDDPNAKYEKNKEIADAVGVGEWGGSCTCPDGSRYEVGDNLAERTDEDCGGLECIGGVAGLNCSKHYGEWSYTRVECGKKIISGNSGGERLLIDRRSNGNDDKEKIERENRPVGKGVSKIAAKTKDEKKGPVGKGVSKIADKTKDEKKGPVGKGTAKKALPRISRRWKIKRPCVSSQKKDIKS